MNKIESQNSTMLPPECHPKGILRLPHSKQNHKTLNPTPEVKDTKIGTEARLSRERERERERVCVCESFYICIHIYIYICVHMLVLFDLGC